MLTDIFAHRYAQSRMWETFYEEQRRLLVQSYQLLNDICPYYVDGNEDKRGKEFWTQIHDLLARELGLKELSPSYIGYYNKQNQWQGFYRPDLEETFAGAIWLRHPSKRCKHPRLYLYPSGLVVSPGSSDDFRFYRDDEDEARFQKFLRSVPTPTLWDRTRDWRTNVAAWGIILAVCGGSTLFPPC